MDEARRVRFLANIHNESHRIQRIVDRMLELAALENRKRLRKIEFIKLHPLVKTVIESKEPMLSRKRLETRIHIPDGLTVKGDGFLLHQAVSNLLQNALDFSPEGGVIEIAAHRSGDRVRIAVTDDGPGIPDFAGNKIFDKFFSLQRPDTGHKSTGLGLNFVREVATLHGGEVRLENRPVKGAAAISADA
jgi:two-component system sensor histidine kinase CreC